MRAVTNHTSLRRISLNAVLASCLRGVGITVFASTVILGSSAAMAQTAAVPSKLVGAAEITKQMNSKGAAHVIVFMANDNETAKFSKQIGSRSERAAAISAIRQRVDPVLRDYYPSGRNSRGDSVKAFRLMAGFATEVTAAELRRMQSDTRIFKIEIDEIKTTNLNSSIELIGMGAQVTSVSPDAAPNGAGRTVAVIDTGVERSHPFIGDARVVAEACFLTTVNCPNGMKTQVGQGASAAASGQSHGTHVAGIAMGSYAAGAPVNRGVASKANLVMVNVFGSGNGAYTSDIIRGLEFVDDLKMGTEPTATYGAISSIDSVNMSLGGGSYDSTCDSDAAKPAIDALRANGVLSVIAAGNSSSRSAMSSPGCISSAISVASSSKSSKTVASYSNISPATTVFSPGGESGACVTSSILGGTYAAYCGTSMAAPHVAGIISLLRAANSATSSDDIVAAITAGMPSILDTRSGGSVAKPFVDVPTALNNIVNPRSSAVTINISPAAVGVGGFVNATLGGLVCANSICKGSFLVGSTVTLNAVPNTLSKFSAWSIPGATCNTSSCEIVIPDAQSLSGTVTFETSQVSLNEAIDNSMSVLSSGTGAWFGLLNSAKSKDGVDVARNPVLGNSQSSSMQTSVTGPGTLAFSWAVSSESGYDYLRFFVNGVEQTTGISGSRSHAPIMIAIPCGGPHTLRWTYSKDGSVASGDDAGYVDQVSYTQGAPCASTYSLTVAVTPSSYGRITSSPTGINCGSGSTTCSRAFTSGSTVTLTATPARKRSFTGWSGACTGTSRTCVVTMNQAQSVTGSFR